MTATARVATMVITDVDLCTRPTIIRFQADPMSCDHVWEPHLWESGRAYCPCCGSLARWVNDPRLEAA